MNRKYGWQAAAAELAEVVRTAGARVAFVGVAMMAMVAAPVLLRAYVLIPW